ncbi:MAG: hypothetical protein ABIH23_11505 [bacterium]
MIHRGRLVEELSIGSGRSVSEVWEVLESLRIAWATIGRIPCAEIDDLYTELDFDTLNGVVDLLTQPTYSERYVA